MSFLNFSIAFGISGWLNQKTHAEAAEDTPTSNAKAAREELNFRTMLFSFFIFLPPFSDNALQSNRLAWLTETDCTSTSWNQCQCKQYQSCDYRHQNHFVRLIWLSQKPSPQFLQIYNENSMLLAYRVVFMFQDVLTNRIIIRRAPLKNYVDGMW